MDEVYYAVKGGIVGRIRDVEDNNQKVIAAQFKYYAETDDSDKTESPIYILDPWTARYVGWHLFRRGVVDGIKDRIRRKPIEKHRILRDS